MATAPEDEVVTDADERAKPPFLRRVRIRGYKSIAFCDVALEPLTILVGRNASGKSNFIDALAFLRDVVSFGVNEAVKRHGGAEAILCRLSTDREILIEIECSYEDISEEVAPWQATYRMNIEFPKNHPARIRHEHLRLAQDKWWVGYTNRNGHVTCSASDDEPQDRLWKVKDRPFLESYTDSPVPDFSEGLERLTAYNFHPEAIRRLQAPSPWFLEHDGSNLASVIELTRENDEEVIQRVGRYLSVITGSVSLLGTVKYGEYETVRFRVNRNERDRPLDFDAVSMSDGTLRALAALVAAFQIDSSQSHPSLVAIEEPDTALHPAAMRALVDALDEATGLTQILLTTHSAEMLDNPTIRPENVRVVQMIDGQTVIGPVDEASVEIVRRNLSTLGGLERDNQLEPDLDDRERQRQLAQCRPESPP